VADGGFEARLVQNGAQHEAPEGGLAADRVLGLAAQAVPDRVDRTSQGRCGFRLHPDLIHRILLTGPGPIAEHIRRPRPLT